MTSDRNLILAGTVYLHKINLNRMGATSKRSLRRMSDLCPDKKKVALVTTMWNQIYQREDGIKREECLNNTYWKPLLDAGASVHRFENTSQSAWSIINAILVQDSKDVNDCVKLGRTLERISIIPLQMANSLAVSTLFSPRISHSFKPRNLGLTQEALKSVEYLSIVRMTLPFVHFS